jgi:hypothetical protein
VWVRLTVDSEVMQQLGRQAINFLEGTTESLSPRRRIGASDELSFDHCFYIYGGRQSFEELEALGNECARLCNRLRTKLAPEGKARLDAALASLGPMFDLQVRSFLTTLFHGCCRAFGSVES